MVFGAIYIYRDVTKGPFKPATKSLLFLVQQICDEKVGGPIATETGQSSRQTIAS